jgi:hypothetical protein
VVVVVVVVVSSTVSVVVVVVTVLLRLSSEIAVATLPDKSDSTPVPIEPLKPAREAISKAPPNKIDFVIILKFRLLINYFFPKSVLVVG